MRNKREPRPNMTHYCEKCVSFDQWYPNVRASAKNAKDVRASAKHDSLSLLRKMRER